jgi:type VI secretion system secreted protein VgrG
VQRDPVQRRFYGVVRRVEQRGTTGSHRLARITLAPSLWALSQRSDARVFQDMTAVEVALAVLHGAGLYAGMAQVLLQRELPKRAYCVQYRETDLAFFERLLESEGVTYFFRHDLQSTEALVLTDGFHHAQVVPTMDGGPVPIAGPESITLSVEAVRNLTWQREQRPVHVTVRDFDFTRPHLPIEGFAPKRGVEARALYEPAPALAITAFEGVTYTRDDGREQAQLRVEEQSVGGAGGGGEGLVTSMTPGMCFAVTLAGGHVPDERYLLTQVTHAGDAQEELLLASEREALRDQRYKNTFQCVLQDAPYRPARRTPRPVVAGLQTATVTGPAGEEVFTDVHGRVRVQFHWDRQGRKDERSSCWVRAVQGPWAGGGWGFQFLPRVGSEVAVSFLEGDPDRPVIVGALFNGQNLPPFELPTHRTRSGIRTQSVGGVGHNELSFEDAAGGERVRLHAQRDLEAVVRRERRAEVGGDDVTDVAGEARYTGGRGAAVSLREGLALGADHAAVRVSNDLSLTAERDLRTHAARSRHESVGGAAEQTVGGDLRSHVDGGVTLFVGADRDLTVQGDDLSAVFGDRSASVRGDDTGRVAGAWDLFAQGDAALGTRGALTLRARAAITLRCGESVIEMTPDEVVIRATKVRVEGGEQVALEAPRASLELEDGAAKLEATARVALDGKVVRLAAKDAELNLGADGVEGSAKKAVTLAGNGAFLALDGAATLKGSQVKLARGAGGAAFKSRIGLPDSVEDIHVLATQLFSPGGMPLARELVQLIDPRTDEPFGPPQRTDAQGELRVEVPHPGPWDLRIVHDAWEEPEVPHDDEVTTELHAQFVDPSGASLTDLEVRVRGAVDLDVRTDEAGRVHLEVPPGPYTLEVPRDDDDDDDDDDETPRRFVAHATLRADRTRGEGQSYVFVIEPADPGAADDARAHREAAAGIESAEEDV